ncbi:MAG: prepilin-type N-terminal cleavage/methylation domain-containing protein [Endomicrobia bacterium]|nr:prepilin-type N-terminal cleavage/methylation domain-containing protein [Endomicrobiia bacterium]
MKAQKGMTLIEVMIAMLVLTIAMIGGISFFTSAYRIRYSYLEHANRLDHALRYVERLKVQRRDYPTAGYFQNIGTDSVGFTVYFVNSSSGDVGPEPYFYENYAAGEAGMVRINIKDKIRFRDGNSAGPVANEYLQFYSAKSVMNIAGIGQLIGHSSSTSPSARNSYERWGYVPTESNWEGTAYTGINSPIGYNLATTASTSTWVLDTAVHNSTGGLIYLRSGTTSNGTLSYNFDGIQNRLHKMSNDATWRSTSTHVLIDGKWYGRVLKDTVNDIDTYLYYKYNSSDNENRKFVYKGDYDAFLQLTFDQLKKRAKLYPTTPNTAPPLNYDKWINAIPGDWPKHANKAIYPFYTALRQNRDDIIAGFGYGAVKYIPYTTPKIEIQTGPPPEGGSSSGMSMEYVPHSLRFYRTGNSAGWRPFQESLDTYKAPNAAFFDFIDAQEVESMRILASPGGTFPEPKANSVSIPNVAANEIQVRYSEYVGGQYPPRPSGTRYYGDDICVIAQVSRSIGLGKDRVEKFWWWRPAIWPPTPPVSTAGPNAWETRKDNVNVFGIQLDFNEDFTGGNIRRVTKYRRSAYISMYSVPTEAEAQAMVAVLKETYYDDLNGAVNYMKTKANEKNYKIIYIPFMQLYAHDDYSTLCERRD